MSEFQVGDRVSVEGVVTHVSVSDMGLIEVEGRTGGRSDVVAADATLVERPKRKLRVGSVWERTDCGDGDRFHAIDQDRFAQYGDIQQFIRREATCFDSDPDLWREVPVEELEREAGR